VESDNVFHKCARFSKIYGYLIQSDLNGNTLITLHELHSIVSKLVRLHS